MICRRCLLRAAQFNGIPLTNTISRPFAHTSSRSSPATPVTADTATATNPRPHGKPAATSTSAAQPFSEPLTYSPDKYQDLPIETRQKKQPQRVESSVPAGTVLKGLNFMKNKQDPVAMEDEEYPAWLWGCLDAARKKGGKDDGTDEGDLFAKSKKQRRIAAKALRKQQLLHPEMLQPKVPLYEQSIDLPAGDGTLQGARQAGEAREQLTKSMREKRRAKIKENNFLKAMG